MLFCFRLLDALAEDGGVLALLQPASLLLSQVGTGVQNLFELLDAELGVLDLVAASNISTDDLILAVLAHDAASLGDGILGDQETIRFGPLAFFPGLLGNIVVPSVFQLLVELLGQKTGVIRLVGFLVIKLGGQRQISRVLAGLGVLRDRWSLIGDG